MRSWFLVSQLRFDEAIAEIGMALALDPLMLLFLAWSVGIHVAVGRPDEALVEFRKAIELDPHNGPAYYHAGLAAIAKGQYDQAKALLEKSKELVVFPGWTENCLGWIALKTGDEAGARQILGEMIEGRKRGPVSPMCIGCLAFTLGEVDLAFAFLDKAYEERDSLMSVIHVGAERAAVPGRHGADRIG